MDSRKCLTVGLLTACVAATASAQARVHDRWGVSAGLSGGIDQTGLLVEASARLLQTGPVAWEFSASAQRKAQIFGDNKVYVLPYYPPGTPGPDTAAVANLWRAGVAMRTNLLPWPFSRLSVVAGTGVYRAAWHGLPDWDRARPPIMTGYQLVGANVRVWRRVGVELSVIRFLNVKHRDDRGTAQLTVRVGFP